METLPLALCRKIEAEIRFGCAPLALEVHSEGISVKLDHRKTIDADYLISALPAFALGDLLGYPLLSSIPYKTVGVVNLGYKKSVLKQKGFGYLIPRRENEDILGCIWDSSVFPQQNQFAEETRLTVMVGGHENECKELACDAMNKHLGIEMEPDAVEIKIAKQSIPQYEIGYDLIRERFKAQLSPRIYAIGSAFDGVSVNDCISQASTLLGR